MAWWIDRALHDPACARVEPVADIITGVVRGQMMGCGCLIILAIVGLLWLLSKSQ